jgi:flagellar hook-length control protein FliK
MAARGQQEGSLVLSPEHLGPLEVRISVSQNTAQVWFGAQQAETRAALTDSLPRLRELFSEAGLSLGHAGVSQEAPGRQLPEVNEQGGLAESTADPAVPEPERVTLRNLGSALLDLYV